MNTTEMKMITRQMLRLLPVKILSATIGAINGIVTGLFAANFVGAVAMSAVGLYSPVSMFVGAISTLIVGGATILCGQYLGKDLKEKTQNVFSLTIILSIIVSAVLIVFHLLMPVFFPGGFAGYDPSLWKVFKTFLLGQTIGILPIILGNQLAVFLSLENQSKRTVLASIIYIVANPALNYLFLVILKKEALGLALASSLSAWIYLAAEIGYFFTDKSFLKLRLTVSSWKEGLRLVLLGLPGSLGYIYQSIRGIIVNSLILEYVGQLGVSAFTTANSFLGLFWGIVGGMFSLSSVLISISVGEEDRTALINVMKVVLFRYVPIMLAVSLVIVALAVPFTNLYYHDPSDPVYQMTVNGFRILPFAMPLSIICMNFNCYWENSGRRLPVHLLAALDGAVSVCLFTAILIPLIGLNSVYLANVINGLVSAVFIVLYSTIVGKKAPKTVADLMLIPEHFGVEATDRMEMTIQNIQEVVTVSEKVQHFCETRGLDQRRSYLAALCLEEMTSVIVQERFAEDNIENAVDIRVIYKNDDVILRIKDDCVPFDPQERVNIIDPEDPIRNVGIRMVYQMAKKVSYQNLLGVNILNILI